MYKLSNVSICYDNNVWTMNMLNRRESEIYFVTKFWLNEFLCTL